MAKTKTTKSAGGRRTYIDALCEMDAKRARAKKLYDEAGGLVNEALDLGVPIGAKIVMPDGAEKVLIDKLKGGEVHTVFVPAFFRRYELAEWKASKKDKDPSPRV